MKDPGNDDQHVQHQCVLVTQPQTTTQRSPVCNLTRWSILMWCNWKKKLYQALLVWDRQADYLTIWMCYPSPLCGVLSTVKGGSQDEEQTNKKVVEGEDLGHHGPLPAQPGDGKQPASQNCPRTRTCQPENEREQAINKTFQKGTTESKGTTTIFGFKWNSHIRHFKALTIWDFFPPTYHISQVTLQSQNEVKSFT